MTRKPYTTPKLLKRDARCVRAVFHLTPITHIKHVRDCSCEGVSEAEREVSAKRPDMVVAAESFIAEWLPGDEEIVGPLAEELNDAYNAGWHDHETAAPQMNYPKTLTEAFHEMIEEADSEMFSDAFAEKLKRLEDVAVELGIRVKA